MILAPVVAIFAVILAVSIASRRQHRAASAQVHRLILAAQSAEPQRLNIEQLDAVPVPVARYLRWALPRDPNVGVVRMTQIGALRTNVHSDRWMAFKAEHIASAAAVGFIWSARVSVAPVVRVHVRDTLIEGIGSGHVSFLSMLTMMTDLGSLEMNSGALHRFLAEAVWYPTALLPTPNLRWFPLDSNRALAELTDHGISVSLEFRFAESGEVASIYTPARWGRFGSSYEQAGWEGHFRAYRQRDGIFVPTEAEVGWYVSNQWRAVWKGTITAFQVQPRI